MQSAVTEHLDHHADRFVEELRDFLRIPSISAQAEHRQDMQRAAEFLQDRFRDAGLSAEIIPTEGHSIVYAEWTGAGDAPTVLVYGHYDVQPPDPLDEWTSPPFEPEIRDDHIYARGATDDKGQLYTHVKSVEAWMKTQGRLPVNVKFVVEGEEEVGSNNLERFLADNRDKCRCDVAVISDTSQYGPDMPAITYGLRGIIACEVTVRGPTQDLHSGMFGGSVANPVNALSGMIAALHSGDGGIAIPGFYDDVAPLSNEERQRLANLPFDEASYLQKLGSGAVWGEPGFTTLERRWCRPTCDVNGIFGGYTGEGPKTIVPTKAAAKISCRLVPHQDPEKLAAALEEHLRSHLLPGLQMTFQSYHGAGALVFDIDSPYMDAAKAAIEEAFGVAPVFIREGGSIPVVANFKEHLGVDTLLLGWGQDTDNLHSPNERFSLKNFQRGTRASAALWEELARR